MVRDPLGRRSLAGLEGSWGKRKVDNKPEVGIVSSPTCQGPKVLFCI